MQKQQQQQQNNESWNTGTLEQETGTVELQYHCVLLSFSHFLSFFLKESSFISGVVLYAACF